MIYIYHIYDIRIPLNTIMVPVLLHPFKSLQAQAILRGRASGESSACAPGKVLAV